MPQDLGDLVPVGGGTVEFAAVDADGAPFAGACLQVHGIEPWAPIPQRIVCDRRGRARLFGVPTGTCCVHSGDDYRCFSLASGDAGTIELRATNRR